MTRCICNQHVMVAHLKLLIGAVICLADQLIMLLDLNSLTDFRK